MHRALRSAHIVTFRSAKSSLCNIGISATARHEDVAASWTAASETEDPVTHFFRDEEAVLPGDVFAPAPNGVNRPTLESYEAFLASLPDGSSPASTLAQMAEAFEDEQKVFNFKNIPLAKKNIGPLPVLNDNSAATTYMPLVVQPTAESDGRFYASFRWMSVAKLTEVLKLVRAWYDDHILQQQPGAAPAHRFSPEELRLIGIGQDLLGGFRNLDGRPRSPLLLNAVRTAALPTSQWLLPWQLRVVAGARLDVSFAARDFAQGSERLAAELLKHSFGAWTPWAALELGGCGVRLPYDGPAILELQGLLEDSTSRNDTLLEVLEFYRARLHRILLFPFAESKMEINRNVVHCCYCMLPPPENDLKRQEPLSHAFFRLFQPASAEPCSPPRYERSGI